MAPDAPPPKGRGAFRYELGITNVTEALKRSNRVRLLRMAVEIMETGRVVVKRPDAEELLAIRNGAWSYEKLLEYADAALQRLDELYRTSKTLPTSPDRPSLDRLCRRLVADGLQGSGFRSVMDCDECGHGPAYHCWRCGSCDGGTCLCYAR